MGWAGPALACTRPGPVDQWAGPHVSYRRKGLSGLNSLNYVCEVSGFKNYNSKSFLWAGLFISENGPAGLIISQSMGWLGFNVIN